MKESDLIDLVRSNWGTKTLEAFRLESERQPGGGVFEAIREPGGRRVAIMLCATRPEDIESFVKMFSLIDDGVGDDWKSVTLLDLLMSSKDVRLGFSCLRDKEDGRRRALIFVAHDPRSVSIMERVFGLSA